jgi:hypothetical protein
MTDPTGFPEGQAPAAPEPAPHDYGADPETIQRALEQYNQLNNLDTRSQALQQIIRPDYDGQVLRGFIEPQQAPQQADPWGHLSQEEAYEEPTYEQPGIDPADLRQTLDPVFQGYSEQVEQRIFERLAGMAQDQAVKESASAATRQAGLPARFSAAIEHEVREATRLQPNRQPAEIAAEIATAYRNELAAIAATPPAARPPAGSVPSGPSPDTLQKPRTMEEALEYSKQVLG